MAPPLPIHASSVPGRTTAVRITMLRSKAPLTLKNPTLPEYTPRGPGSRLSMISKV
jgi:hypothetical protein